MAIRIVAEVFAHYKSNKEALRQTHLEVFGDEKQKAVLFDYGKRDLLGNAEYKIMETAEIQV